jgi:hypothetical protein
VEKGYGLVPRITRLLRQSDDPPRVLVHNGSPNQTAVDDELASIAVDDPGVIFEHRSADHIYWQGLLDRTDLMILPYEPQRFVASYSAVACEAASDGIPMVVPENTTLSVLADIYQGRAVSFAGWSAEAVASATVKAIADFDAIADLAADGAVRWRAKNGAQAFADRLLGRLHGPEQILEPPPPASITDRFEGAALESTFYLRQLAMAAVGPLLARHR